MVSTTVESEIGSANRHKSSVGNVSGLASCQVWEAGLGHFGESSKHLRKFRVGTLNVNTLRGRVCKVVETYPAGKWMSAAFRRPDTLVATATQSRARTPGTRSTGPEMQRHCWCRSVCGGRVDRESF